MQQSDYTQFERALNRLCAGFDTPLTDARRDAYWRSFRKLTVLEFTGLVDMAIVESSFVSMPTVGVLWDLHRKVQSPKAEGIPRSGPTLQEQLCEWVAPQIHAMVVRGEISAWEFSRAWTYVYREWRDGDKRCAECIGVMIEYGQGKRMYFTVADMRSQVEARQLRLQA